MESDPHPSSTSTERVDCIERRRKELEFLASHLSSHNGRQIINSIQRAIAAKFLVRRKLWARARQLSSRFGETYIAGVRTPIDTRMAYAYQRFDLRISNQEIYSRLTEIQPAISHSLLTNGGMAAISAAFMTLSQCFRGNVHIDTCPSGYFETANLVRFLEHTGSLVSSSSAGSSQPLRVIVLDSYGSSSPSENRKWDRADFVLVDTTCLSCEDRECERIYEECYRHKIPLCFVRSHHKLDSFGIEYSRLGSICTFLPPSVSGKVHQALQLFVERLGVTCTLFGLRPSLYQIFPWLCQPQAKELTNLRLAFTVNACRKMLTELRRALSQCDYLLLSIPIISSLWCIIRDWSATRPQTV